MKITVKRKIFTAKSTIGELYVDDVFECFTLEDVRREKKISGETCIPKGEYQVVINQSNRFKCLMPQILNVPSFDGIRIHSGNTDKDTHGCILVGLTKAPDFIGKSKEAYEKLFNKLNAANRPITIEIKE